MVRPSNLPLWFAAVFAAGGALGAVGVASIRTSAPAADATQAAKGPRGRIPETQRPVPADDAVSPVDREALRAVVTELLEEEARSASLGDDSDPAGEGEGVSAADALARLEAAYRAELEAREGEEPMRELEYTSAAKAESREGDHELPEVPAAPEVRPLVEVEEPGAEEAEPELLARADAADRDAESGNVQVGSVQVVNGDVNHVDARQTHASQVAVINHYQPVFVQPWFDTAPTQGQLRGQAQAQGQGHASSSSSRDVSPLSKPMPSAHDQSPWSPIDYSRHHNPWGPIFGRPIP